MLLNGFDKKKNQERFSGANCQINNAVILTKMQMFEITIQ